MVEEKMHLDIILALHLIFSRFHIKSLASVLCKSILKLASLEMDTFDSSKTPVSESISAYMDNCICGRYYMTRG